ncbi:MAG TPA: hypothetical protein VNU28_05490, partial [Solirubrobacteraceae bacterium]|nr:hypothetical protein [Solirubrobacteraceae bacterium]
MTTATAAPKPSALVASLVNAGAVVVRVASAPPVAFVFGLVLAGVVVVGEDLVVPVVAVRWVALPDGSALDTDTVFAPDDPQPPSANAPTA